MGCILLTAGIALISIVLIFVKDDTIKCISAIILMLDIVVSLAAYPTVMMNKEEVDNVVETYYSLKKQVEVVNSSNDKALRNAIIPDLQKRVEDINKIISKNDLRYDNWWNSVFYYEKIGELEQLKIKNYILKK